MINHEEKSLRCRLIGSIASAMSMLLAGIAGAQPTTRPRDLPPLPLADPADVARLGHLGKRNATVHDPSTIVRCGDIYWTYATDRGIAAWRSTDLTNWTRGPKIFDLAPPWVAGAVPTHRGNHFWAPDVVKLADDRYLLFYSASTFGKNTSGIGVASNQTLDPDAPTYHWIDGGLVVASTPSDNFNAIDPSVFHDVDGKLWLAFGSFWSGIQLVALDPTTGKRLHPTDKPIALANNREIEAACLARHGDRYYLFVNWGLCCRGVNSTYEIRVGRSDRVEGPYLDRDGKDMKSGGGTSFLSTDGKFIGPGHAGILVDASGREWLSCHFYDGTENGVPHLSIRPLTWDAEGWPVVGTVDAPATQPTR